MPTRIDIAVNGRAVRTDYIQQVYRRLVKRVTLLAALQIMWAADAYIHTQYTCTRYVLLFTMSACSLRRCYAPRPRL